MAREIPELVRAAAGLAATVIDEARKLPQTLPGLSVRLAGLAMQTAMKVQQSYSGLVARGDEIFTGIRGEQEPGLATFDDEVEAQTGGYRESKFDRADVTFADNEVAGLQESLDDAAATAPSTDDVLDELAIDQELQTAPETTPPATSAPAKGAGGKQAAKKAAPAQKSTGSGAAGSDVVTEGRAAVDEAAGSQAAPPEDGAATTATATDESGGTVAAATGVRTDVGPTDTSADDAAIAT